MRSFVALMFAISEVAWACPGIQGIELKDGANPIHGLSSVRIEKAATVLTAGDVSYKIYSTYANDGKAMDPANLEDADRRAWKQEVCIEVKGMCGANPSTICFKGLFGNDGKKTVSPNNKNVCANLKSSLKSNSTDVYLDLKDSKGVIAGKLDLVAKQNVRADLLREGEMRSLSRLHDSCQRAKAKKQGGKATDCQLFELSRPRWEQLRSIENSVMHYAAKILPSKGTKPMFTIESESMYYRNLAGEGQDAKLEPVELFEDADHLNEQKEPTAMIQHYTVTKSDKDVTPVANNFEFKSDNYSPVMRSVLPAGSQPGNFDIGVAKSLASVDGCKLNGGEAFGPTPGGSDDAKTGN